MEKNGRRKHALNLRIIPSCLFPSTARATSKPLGIHHALPEKLIIPILPKNPSVVQSSCFPFSPFLSFPLLESPLSCLNGPYETEGRNHSLNQPVALNTSLSHSVPTTPQERQRVLAHVRQVVAEKGYAFTVNRASLEIQARSILEELGVSEDHLAWTMVLLGCEFWKPRILTIPPARRTLLLPHCLRDSQSCPAAYDAEGLHCLSCGRCVLAELKRYAESLGYSVLIAEGTPIVMKSILSGKTDAILGVGCLKSLERAFDQLQLAGIPAAAVPLLNGDCKDSVIDPDWVRELIDIPYHPQTITNGNSAEKISPTWLHLLRQAASLAEEILPQWRELPQNPLTSTERIACDFLASGGKYYRPFITLAAFDALTGSRGTQSDGAKHVAAFPSIVKQTALAIEVFHKASLIHDDIEDGDSLRYGQPTLHNQYGVPIAVNLGDYLIGLGYRLITADSPELGKDSGLLRADLLAKMSEAHIKLCEGQGAELFWRVNTNPAITPAEVLKIYGLKTAPAFEAALYAGIRLGTLFRPEKPESDENFLEKIVEPITRFARYWGTAFQIKNDLEDWIPNENKRIPAQDVVQGRPTILRAFALELLPEKDRVQFLKLGLPPPSAADQKLLEQIHTLYEKAGVFEKAELLIEKYIERAGEVVSQINHEPLRNFLRRLFEPLHFQSEFALHSPPITPNVLH